jgi:integrase/recombinase XerD
VKVASTDREAGLVLPCNWSFYTEIYNKYHKAAKLLKRFDDYAFNSSKNEPTLTKEIVLGWTKRVEHETKSTQQGRISVIRGLAEYMSRTGKVVYIYPKGTDSVERYSYTPYIFSKKEIAAIFRASDNYAKSETSPHRHLMLPLIIRMLYCCGLRISEVTNLTVAAINLIDGTIYVKGAKFGKERLIPMSENLTKRCCEYSEKVLAGRPLDSFFFPSPYNGHYDSSTVYCHFRRILWEAGISHTGNGPRLHDVRHTFAVHCLKKWVLAELDLTNCLPYLSAYLGHEDMRGTQHYLRLTADLYPDIIQKVELSCSWLIPEVNSYEAD